jgi:hypothetical protein
LIYEVIPVFIKKIKIFFNPVDKLHYHLKADNNDQEIEKIVKSHELEYSKPVPFTKDEIDPDDIVYTIENSKTMVKKSDDNEIKDQPNIIHNDKKEYFDKVTPKKDSQSKKTLYTNCNFNDYDVTIVEDNLKSECTSLNDLNDDNEDNEDNKDNEYILNNDEIMAMEHLKLPAQYTKNFKFHVTKTASDNKEIIEDNNIKDFKKDNDITEIKEIKEDNDIKEIKEDNKIKQIKEDNDIKEHITHKLISIDVSNIGESKTDKNDKEDYLDDKVKLVKNHNKNNI